MSFIDTVQGWFFHKAVGRAAVAAGKAAAAYALAHSGALSHYGVSVSINPDLAAAAIMGGIHLAADWAAFHFPKTLGWLHPHP